MYVLCAKYYSLRELREPDPFRHSDAPIHAQVRHDAQVSKRTTMYKSSKTLKIRCKQEGGGATFSNVLLPNGEGLIKLPLLNSTNNNGFFSI